MKVVAITIIKASTRVIFRAFLSLVATLFTYFSDGSTLMACSLFHQCLVHGNGW